MFIYISALRGLLSRKMMYRGAYRSGPLLSGTVTLALYCIMGGRTGETDVPGVKGIQCQRACSYREGRRAGQADNMYIYNTICYYHGIKKKQGQMAS